MYQLCSEHIKLDRIRTIIHLNLNRGQCGEHERRSFKGKLCERRRARLGCVPGSEGARGAQGGRGADQSKFQLFLTNQLPNLARQALV